MLHSPCREDRANAAISWMVRALLDFGNISTVSSTFTWNDKKRRAWVRGKLVTVAQLSMNGSQPPNTSCSDSQENPSVVSSWRRDSCVLQCTSRPREVKDVAFAHWSMLLMSHKLCANNRTRACMCMQHFAPRCFNLQKKTIPLKLQTVIT